MSREEDDTRQYQCLRKYEAIVKKVCGTSVFRFDELINMVDARTRRPPKRRRVAVSSSTSSAQPGSGRGSTSSAAASTPSTHQPVASMDEVFVQTITRFLHELNTTPAHRDDGSSNANED